MTAIIFRTGTLLRAFEWSLGCGLALLCSTGCGGRASVPGEDLATGGGAPSASAGSGVVPAGGSPGAGANAGGAGTIGMGGIAETGGSSSAAAGTGNAGGGSGGGLGGSGGQPPSCAQLPANCGPSSNVDCCASSVVPGGTYDRQVNGNHFPTTVSDFRLDRFEITVGRFRKFVAVYAPNMIPVGAGKNPSNPADPGWDAAWNASLPPNASALTTALKCDVAETWTDSPGNASAESLPIDCITWFEAEAFCTWDGGRLATDAEWNYVSAGGAEQRRYPWGSPDPDCTFANYLGASGGTEPCVRPPDGAPNRVGAVSPKGDSKWGHADLAGNVAEWTQDFTRLLAGPCDNCANLAPGATARRVIKGGSFGETVSTLLSSFHVSAPPEVALNLFGARCARSAR